MRIYNNHKCLNFDLLNPLINIEIKAQGPYSQNYLEKLHISIETR